jgi:hypothetical protein
VEVVQITPISGVFDFEADFTVRNIVRVVNARKLIRLLACNILEVVWRSG